MSSKTTSLSKGSKGLAILFSGGKKFSRFFTPPYDSNTLFHDLVNWAFIIWNVLEKEGLEIAEEIEHIKNAKFFKRMQKILGDKNIDPHGTIIPRCKF